MRGTALRAFCGKIVDMLGEAGDVSARPCEVRDDAVSHRISLNAMTMGSCLFARFAATMQALMRGSRSTLLATNSVASAGRRSNCPSAER